MKGFTDINDLLEHTTALDQSVDLVTLSSSQKTAIATIRNIIPDEVLSFIEDTTSDDIDKKKVLADALDYLKLALANRIMFNYLPYWAVSKNNSEQKLYKYQFENLKDDYIKQFWSAMDSLLNLLDNKATDSFFKEWKTADIYKNRQELLIKSAKDFSYYFNISGSSYFFSQIQYLIREVTASEINTRFGSLSDTEKATLLDKYKDTVMRALCYEVMARVVKVFDLTELPESLRKDITSEYSTSGSMMQNRDRLSTELEKKASLYLLQMETAVSKSLNKATGIEDYNRESNKFFSVK